MLIEPKRALTGMLCCINVCVIGPRLAVLLLFFSTVFDPFGRA